MQIAKTTNGSENLSNQLYPLNLYLVTWKEWQKPDKSYISIEKVTKEAAVRDLLFHIKNMRGKFVAHVEVKRNQSEVFKLIIEKAKNDLSTAALQVDWAENYKCFTQNATQAAHFGQNQISIFNAALWIQQLKSFAIVSDSLDHTKTSVVANLDKICGLLPGHVDNLHVFSDNATSQFKNKDTYPNLIFIFLEEWKKDNNCDKPYVFVLC